MEPDIWGRAIGKQKKKFVARGKKRARAVLRKFCREGGGRVTRM